MDEVEVVEKPRATWPYTVTACAEARVLARTRRGSSIDSVRTGDGRGARRGRQGCQDLQSVYVNV